MSRPAELTTQPRRTIRPFVTACVVTTCLVLAVVPGATEALEYRHAAVARAPWRLLGSQLVHWSVPMLVADLLLLGIVGSVAEGRSRRLTVLAMALGAAATATVLLVGGAGERYRGSSGIGTAMLVAASLDLAARPASRFGRPLAAAALLVLAVKLLLDLSGSGAAHLSALPAGVRVAWEVHLGAAAAGGVAWTLERRTERRIGSGSSST